MAACMVNTMLQLEMQPMTALGSGKHDLIMNEGFSI